MSAIRIGSREAHEKTTARLFWREVGQTGYNDAGSVREYADATVRSLVNRSKSRGGFRQVNDEQVDVNHQAWTFLLDERVPEQERIIALAKITPAVAQAFGEAVTATLALVSPGKWYDIGSVNIANVSVSGSVSGDLDEGVDFQVDTQNGRLYVEPDGTVPQSDTLLVTFDRPAMELETVKSQQKPLFRCEVLIEEHNQFSKTWLRKIECTACLSVIEFPQNAGDFSTYRLKVTAATKPTISKRPEAQDLATPPQDEAGASSSSSSSSATSQSTSSSYSSPSSPSSLSSSSSSSYSSLSSQSSSSSTVASETSSSSSSQSSSSTAASFTSSSSYSSSSSNSSSSNSSSSTAASVTSSSSTAASVTSSSSSEVNTNSTSSTSSDQP